MSVEPACTFFGAVTYLLLRRLFDLSQTKMKSAYALSLTVFVVLVTLQPAELTMYMKRGEYLEPVLEPISSTVESIPIYKLSRGFEIGPVKEHIDKTTLLTAKNINKLKEDETRKDENAKIKPLK